MKATWTPSRSNSGSRSWASGTPKEIFSRGEELAAMGLGVPEMTRVFARLRAMGFDVPASVYTVEQARDAILLARKGGKG